MRTMPQFTSSDSALTADVRKILGRPKFIERVQMVTPVAQSVALSHQFYEDTFGMDTRFAGNLGFRATTCFRIVVAASPQVGGRLRAFYNPNATYRGVSQTTRSDNWKNSVITGYTQLPGVELDLETATAIDFKIPYTSYLEYMPIRGPNGETNPRMTLGTFQIRDYLPIASDFVNQAVPYYTLYAWLEDIEIFGARNYDLYSYDFNTDPETFIADTYVPLVGPSYNLVGGSLQLNPKTGQSSYSLTLDAVVGVRQVTITGVALSTGTPGTESLWGTAFSGDVGFEPCYGTQDSSSLPTNITLTVSFYIDEATQGAINFVPSVLANIVDNEIEVELQAAEEDIEKDGPLSGPLYKLSKAANLVGSAIPSISSITTPLGWFTRAASNAAAAFGFSRPLQLEQNHRFWSTQNHYQNNADGPDTCFSLGLLQDNKVCQSGTVGGTDVDEMALSYLTQKSVALARFAIGPNDVGMRYTVACSPMAMYLGADGTPLPMVQPPITYSGIATGDSYDPSVQLPGLYSGQVVTPTPLFMLGTMFKLFRGGFKFTLKTNKTRFHGGRLLITYTPYTQTVPDKKEVWAPEQIETTVSNEADLYGHTVIWDLRESSECVIECPYIFNTPYLECNESFGSLCIAVIDNINAPPNVVQDLTFVLEVAGLEGFEFARPELKDYVVNLDDDYRSRDAFSYNPTDVEVQLQSGVCPFETDTSDKSCEAIGEKILSVKQLISRAEYLPAKVLAAEPESNSNIRAITLRPWFQTYNGIGTFSNLASNPGFDYHFQGSYVKSVRDILSSAYMFCKGSTCYDVISSNGFAISLAPDEVPANGLLGKASNVLENGPYGHVKLPYYARTTKLPTNPLPYDIDAVDPARGSVTKPINLDFGQALFYGTTEGTAISIRAGDDAQLGFFVGCPRLMIASGAGFAPRISSGGTSGGAIYGAADTDVV